VALEDLGQAPEHDLLAQNVAAGDGLGATSSGVSAASAGTETVANDKCQGSANIPPRYCA